MEYRTDLALEERELRGECSGVRSEEHRIKDVTVSRITVETESGARSLGKPVGSYITVEMPPLTDSTFTPDERYETVSSELAALLPEDGTVLAVGLGNSRITPDALGPRTASQIAATRHITEELHRSAGFDSLRSCAGEKIEFQMSTPLTSVNIVPADGDSVGKELFMLLPVRMKD